MKILQIISGRGVNGALVYCKVLSEDLVRRGHQVTILCRPGSWIQSHVDTSLVRIVESEMTRFPLTELKRMAGYVRDQRFDLMHSHMTRGQNFGVGLKWLTGVPVIATAHNRHLEFHWNFNDYVIANSQATFDYHRRVNRISPQRMETIYCCTDSDRQTGGNQRAVQAVRQKLRLRPDDFLIGMIGEISVRKGHLQLVRALPDIVRQVPQLKVVFVGRFGRRQSHTRKIRRFLLRHGLAGRTCWVGRRANVCDFMAASEITVVPSLEEPLGLVAIESLMTGTPVVASRTGGLTEIVRHRENGLLVPPANPGHLAQAIVSLARDEKLRSQLGQQGRRSVADNFAPRRLIDAVENVYNRMANTRHSAAA